MGAREVRIRRWRIMGPAAAFLLVIGIAGCFVGYTGSAGRMLRAYLAPAALLELTQNPVPCIWIVDVRSASAYQEGHIPKAMSFPSSEIESRLDELAKDIYLIVHCETGILAQKVIVEVLEPNGYTRFMNWGGIYRWPYALETGTE